MIKRGLSCDRVEFGHFGGGQMTPLTPPWLRACVTVVFIKTYQNYIVTIRIMPQMSNTDQNILLYLSQ